MDISFANSCFYLHQGDITQAETEAIVNAANPYLAGGGGVDGAIHKAAGPKLLQAGQEIVSKRGCVQPGEAVITPGFNLKAKYVIHAVGPIWQGGSQNEPVLLEKTYKSCLKLAREHHLKSIAFPAISCGAYGFPWDRAAEIALNSIFWGLEQKLVPTIHFYLYNTELFDIFLQKAREIFGDEKCKPLR
ncbi:MAG: macro domain-containing protein [Desulfonauticus sp.]|nr:macro domain-containing protein [Desulfonauticus sp.]